ncbi:DUF4440 domain-containing protein [uncultured Shewanella sp.]|uniref:nuclear transport factor 2 family protein n=1 Tax=uncultured Shewanella sp. TaxID=173975 RepID=UPI00262DD481|nr:DUF4440 domain-containing protein [uncultured Shewanella sp.]
MNLKETIIELEQACIQTSIRSSRAALEELLDDDFIEIPSTGIPYGKSDALNRIPDEMSPEFTQQDYAITMLASNVVLLTYRATIKKFGKSEMAYSMRSSIWRFNDGHWRMVFHQGTPTPAFDREMGNE